MDEEQDPEVRLRELQEEWSDFKSLLEHPGWKYLDEIAKTQITNRYPSALGRLDNFLDLPGQEFDKGEISGIELFRRIPSVRVESLEEDIQNLEEQLQYDRNERTSPDGTEDGDDFGDTSGDFEPPI